MHVYAGVNSVDVDYTYWPICYTFYPSDNASQYCHAIGFTTSYVYEFHHKTTGRAQTHFGGLHVYENKRVVYAIKFMMWFYINISAILSLIVPAPGLFAIVPSAIISAIISPLTSLISLPGKELTILGGDTNVNVSV